MESFREFVLAWMRRRGWSQARLAEASEISQSLVSKHLSEDERRRVKPSPENLARYAPVLDASYEDLMRMCGYLPSTAERTESDAIEADVKARTADVSDHVLADYVHLAASTVAARRGRASLAGAILGSQPVAVQEHPSRGVVRQTPRSITPSVSALPWMESDADGPRPLQARTTRSAKLASPRRGRHT